MKPEQITTNELVRKAANLGAAQAAYTPTTDVERLALASFGFTASSIDQKISDILIQKNRLAERRREVAARLGTATNAARINLEMSITYRGVLFAIAIIAVLIGLQVHATDWRTWTMLTLCATLIGIAERPPYYGVVWAFGCIPYPFLALREQSLARRERKLNERKQQILEFIATHTHHLNEVYMTYLHFAEQVFPDPRDASSSAAA